MFYDFKGTLSWPPTTLSFDTPPISLCLLLMYCICKYCAVFNKRHLKDVVQRKKPPVSLHMYHK